MAQVEEALVPCCKSVSETSSVEVLNEGSQSEKIDNREARDCGERGGLICKEEMKLSFLYLRFHRSRSPPHGEKSSRI